ncbi:excinuclease ABC subunit UvrA [Alteromonas stellipolaris]|uniref:excinuclease ABC subunit UvrA n=1 Tax=Alteromonas stellipolaris TaxID=233316 RepID=UPI0026E3A5CE|nr:excinuclease ABC subunit UvrA [Alteromonas stellipolaris]MDO6533052.1 excinuclease ABC subunit UvrA [Alteromonas stellipolaris]MDO6624855.1 excinuclease ABC subunit UvrA [Alteromonas stellipolaris]
MTIDNDNFLQIRGARVHNLKGVDVDIPRNKIVAFTGISGSGKSSLAFGTLYAEAQHRYLDSVSPYARRLIEQIETPDVDSIEGLPPAVGLHQNRGAPSIRSSVGSITTISNSLRMLYSRAGDYPANQKIIYADGFSPNTVEGACEQCHGIGTVFDVTEDKLVPDPTLTIREGAIAAWPGAWQGKNLVRVLLSLDIDVDIPWQALPESTRDWILYTDDTPQVPVYRNYNLAQTQAAKEEGEPASYNGKFIGAKHYVLETFKTSQKEKIKQKVAQFLAVSTCPQCHGKKLKQASLSVTLCGLDITAFSRLSLRDVVEHLQTLLETAEAQNNERALVIRNIAKDIVARIKPIIALGLGYLSLERSTTTISAGELQRLRLATQIKSKLFGVVYIMDEPSSGLHPNDVNALLEAFDALVEAGNSVFLVEHNPRVIKYADWIVDIGPNAGTNGGELVFSGPVGTLQQASNSITSQYLFDNALALRHHNRKPTGWLLLKAITKNNLENMDCAFPLGTITTVTGVSGSGKSSLVSHALVTLVKASLDESKASDKNSTVKNAPTEKTTTDITEATLLESNDEQPVNGYIDNASKNDVEQIKRLVVVNQSPIGRTPRSNLATYTGLFDHVRKLFAATPLAKKRRYDAGRFSFNTTKGRCANCEGVGFVSVELLFMPSVYSPCPVCDTKRYNQDTLDVTWNELSIADVLSLSVAEAHNIFANEAPVFRALDALVKVGLGYLRLGQPATELSGGEAQRIKLATELKRAEKKHTLYVLDEPTTGLHPADIALLMKHLNTLVDEGSSVVMVEHNMQVASASDYLIDIGPGAGDAGGKIVARGTPAEVAKCNDSKTAPFITPV